MPDAPVQEPGETDRVERLISADSHVTVSHDDVKAKLPSALHAEYDDAVASLVRTMSGGAGKANQAMMREYDHPAWGRPACRG